MGSAFSSTNLVAGTEFRRLHVRHQESNNANNQAAVNSVWTPRTIDTVMENQIPGASLGSNQITLPAGTYRVTALSTHYVSNHFKTSLYDTTGSAHLVLSVNNYNYNQVTYILNMVTSHLQGSFTLSQQSVLEYRYFMHVGNTGSGLGFGSSNDGVDEVFTDIVIEQEVTAPNISSIQTGELFHVRDEKANGTDGGAATADAWNTRDLNTTLVNEIDGASLSSNQVELPAGSYVVQARCPAYRCQYVRARIQNITDASTVLIGPNYYSEDTTTFLSLFSEVGGKFTLTATKTLELQHYMDRNNGANALGLNDTKALGNEVYSEMFIWKVGN